MFCSQCGTSLPDTAAFCSSCGTQQPAAATQTAPPPQAGPPPQPMPSACPNCGTSVQPGRRFCTSCGHSMTGPAPARRVAAGGAFTLTDMFIAAGLAVSVVATLLDWISGGGQGVSGWDGDSRFRVAEWLGVTAPVDAAIVVAAAVLGALLWFGPRFGIQTPNLPAPAISGGAVLGIGILEWLYIDDVGAGFFDPAIGIYLLILGGAAILLAPFAKNLKA